MHEAGSVRACFMHIIFRIQLWKGSAIMARKSTKNAVSSVDAAMESRVEDIKTEDKAAEINIAEAKATEKKAAKKSGSAKKEVTCSVTVQYGGKELSDANLLKTVKDIWKKDLKRKVGDLKVVELYVKPEENKVYYVVNKEVTGDFDI